MHPTSISLYTRTVVAAGAVAARRFVTSAGFQADSLGEKVLGVNRTTGDQGDALTIDILGSTLVEGGGAIALDDDITTDASGRAVAVTDPATQRTAGRALSVGSIGKPVEILLLPR